MSPLSSKDQEEASSTCESVVAMVFYLSNHYANTQQFPGEKNPQGTETPTETTEELSNTEAFYSGTFEGSLPVFLRHGGYSEKSVKHAHTKLVFELHSGPKLGMTDTHSD